MKTNMIKWLWVFLMTYMCQGLGQVPAEGSQAEVMWALAGVLPRDQAHWVRNFDHRQRISGIATVPMAVKDPEAGRSFTPEELRVLAEMSGAAGSRFFFVVEVGTLREHIRSFPEGRRLNFQQNFAQQVRVTAYRKAPETGQWERLDPVAEMAEDRKMVGTSDVPDEERERLRNQVRCEFLRQIPAETAAVLAGRALVQVEGSFEAAGGGEVLFAYTLTNRSPLPLSTLYVTVPFRSPSEDEDHEFLFGESLQQVGTLAPYGSATGREVIPIGDQWRPRRDPWVTIEGWSQEELDGRRALRERRSAPRSDWREHENLPPEARDMDWTTPEGM